MNTETLKFIEVLKKIPIDKQEQLLYMLYGARIFLELKESGRI